MVRILPTTALEARADPDAQHLFAKVGSVGGELAGGIGTVMVGGDGREEAENTRCNEVTGTGYEACCVYVCVCAADPGGGHRG